VFEACPVTHNTAYIYALSYTVCHKKRAVFIFAITLATVDQF